MGRLLHSVVASLDGYTVDAGGGFDWAVPSPEVEDAFTEQLAEVSTFLYGRRMYEIMAVWDDDAGLAEAMPELSPSDRGWAREWRLRDKVVYSRTLEAVWTARTRLERDFDPGAVTQIVRASDGDVTVEGSTLAAEALRAGIVDVLEVVVVPVVVGGGTPWLPAGVRLDLQLLGTRRFENGMVQLRHGVRGSVHH